MAQHIPPESIEKHIEEVWQNADCIYTKEEIDAATDQMAERITQDFKGKNPLIVCIMNGGLPFTAQIMLRLPFVLQQDYLHVTRYKNKTKGSDLEWIAKPQTPVTGRHVLLVDDILDEGQTLVSAQAFMEENKVASVSTLVLVEKKHERKVKPGLTADYVTLQTDDRYLFGYGMDYLGYLRNAPGVYAVVD